MTQSQAFIAASFTVLTLLIALPSAALLLLWLTWRKD